MTDIAGNRTLSSQWNETVQFYGNQNFLEYISVDDQLTSYTYSEFHYRVIQTANWFHSLGIRKGELVALHLHNSPEYLMCWLALAQIGAVSVPLNEHYRLQESKFVLQKCDIHRIIVEPSSLPIYQSNKEDLLLSTIILAWGECPDPDILSLSASSFFDGSRLDESGGYCRHPIYLWNNAVPERRDLYALQCRIWWYYPYAADWHVPRRPFSFVYAMLPYGFSGNGCYVRHCCRRYTDHGRALQRT